MSRQESARAALRSLASPKMKSNHFEDGSHHSQSYPHPYSIPQGSSSASSQPSFFGNGSGSQIMDSPTSSPSLAAIQSPPSSYRDSFGATGRHAYIPHAKLLRDGSTGTAGTNEIPSLSLSNSSVSDSNLLSPYYETPSSQNHSISSVRTVKPNDSNTFESTSSVQARRLEAIRRAAASMRIPVEEVQKGMEFVDKMMSNRVEESQLAALDDIDREALRRISDTVRSEEERLTQIASFRAAYMQAESMRPEMELHHNQQADSPSSKRSSQQDQFFQQQHQYDRQGPMRRRRNREGVIGLPHSSRTMPPLSPPPAYEHLEMLEYDGHPQHHSMPPAPRSPSLIPSPRAALESLTGNHRNHPYGGGMHDGHPSKYSPGPHPPSSQHQRRPSGSRPLSLPDRSYRSMDDYVTDPLRNGSGISGQLRRSMQAPYPPPSISRNSSRSPLIGDSPYLSGGLDVHPSEYGNASTSPLLNTSNRLTPGSHGPHRKRSGSNTSNRSSILSRRASGDLLGLGIPRSTSPAVSISQEHTPPKLSHEEVMARLQKKVKERIAAREAAAASGQGIAKRHSTPVSTPNSPAFSLYSVSGGTTSQAGGRRRQGSIANSIGASSASLTLGSGGSLPRQRKPRKAVSLKSLGQTASENRIGLDDEEKPLPALPKSSDNNPIAILEDEKDDPMSGVEQEFDPTASEGRLGIEALLSAAAIADSRA